MNYYTCSVGSFTDILYDCILNNYYLLHREARHPAVFDEIQTGDVLILQYCGKCVAAAYAKERNIFPRDHHDGWCKIIYVQEWFRHNTHNCRDGIEHYGIANNIEAGSSQYLSVRKVKAAFGRELLQRMLGRQILTNTEKPSFYTFCINDVAAWWHHADGAQMRGITVSVPILQRGLVWSPKQNELLWDSIFRGIPIGSFVVCTAIQNQIKNEDKEKNDGQKIFHNLLDGQQRSNAIAMGFDRKPFDDENGKAILWLDIAPDENEDFTNTTREFWFRITTTAHPWGYAKSDAGDVRSFCLNVQAKRSAIEACFGKNHLERPKPNQLWPFKSILPMPVAYLMHAYENDNDEVKYWNVVGDKINEPVQLQTKWGSKYAKEISLWLASENNLAQKHQIYEGVKRAFMTTMLALNAPDDLMKSSKREAKANVATGDDISSIEHLFQRLNQQGTTLSGEELIYSMIKAYWPVIADPINECAKWRMPESRMLNLAMRVCLAEDTLPGPFSVSQIRGIIKTNDTRKERIQAFLGLENVDGTLTSRRDENRLKACCEQVDIWFGYIKSGSENGGHANTRWEPEKDWALPKVLRTMLARDCQEIYLMLLYFARRGAQLDGRFVTGLALLLRWFDSRTTRSSRRERIIRKIVEACKGEITESNIKAALFEAMAEGHLLPLPDFSKILPLGNDRTKDEFGKNWSWGDHKNRPWHYPAWERVRNNPELLLYALRLFMGKAFGDYDPARKDLWAEENRPWDIDHIVPQSWFERGGDDGIRKLNREQLVGNIGNLAPLPLSVNRGKNDAADWGYYKTNSHSLFFEPANYDESLRAVNDEPKAGDFYRVTLSRFVQLYNELWTEKGAGVSNIIDFQSLPRVAERRKLFESIRGKLQDAQVYYLVGRKEVAIANNRDWATPWMSVGVTIGHECLVCVSSAGQGIEVGIRKHPDQDALEKNYKAEIIKSFVGNDYRYSNENWWYLYKQIKWDWGKPQDDLIDEIVNNLSKFIAGLNYKNS